MNNEFIEFNRIDMTSTTELKTFPFCIRKSLITGFEKFDSDKEDTYRIGYEIQELFNKQMLNDTVNPRKDERADSPFTYKSIICIYIDETGENYFFVDENYERMARFLGGLDR